MTADTPHLEADEGVATARRREGPSGLGPVLRRAWLGYQLRIDEAMVDEGFGDRKFPDGRVLRLCSNPAGSTISGIGRELGITRQGAGKVVNHLCDRGYVAVSDSPTSGREKSVTLTPRGTRYLEAQRRVVSTIERQLHAELGDEVVASLSRLLETLDPGEEIRMRTYLGSSTPALESPGGGTGNQSGDR